MVLSGTQRTEIVLFHSTQSVEYAVVRADVARFGLGLVSVNPKGTIPPQDEAGSTFSSLDTAN